MSQVPDNINRDELRRAARDMNATAATDTKAMGSMLRAVLDSDLTPAQRSVAFVGRRRFLHVGGFSVATAAVLAACGGTESPGVARIGVAPERTDLPPAVVNDIVLLRTAASVERSAIAVYDLVIGNSDLLDPALDDVVKRFRDDHLAHADLIDGLTIEAGGEPWTCGNPRIDELLIAPLVLLITGAPASVDTPEVPPSDDPRRDVLNVAHGLETMAGETYQAFVPLLSQPSMRQSAMTAASHEARHAALLAITITGRPDGYVQGEAPPDPPPIPTVFAIPGQFGSLAGTTVVVGAQDELGQRRTFSIDTPSLNTYVYEFLTPEC